MMIFIWPTIHELHDYGRLQATSGNVSTRFIICAVINNEFLDGFSSLIKVIRSSTDIYPKCYVGNLAIKSEIQVIRVRVTLKMNEF